MPRLGVGVSHNSPSQGAQTGRKTVTVDVSACARIARTLQRFELPDLAEDTGRPKLNRLRTGNLYLLLVAICHQTSPRGKAPLEGYVEGIHYRGWDYLSAKIAKEAQQDTGLLEPRTWSSMTARHLQHFLHD